MEKIVFVADDDPTFNKLMGLVLKNYGLKAEIFPSYETIYAALEKTMPALCFVDLNLGTTHKGIELVQTIRSKISNTLPIFIVSSAAEPKIIAHAIETGANDYIFKPLDRDTLVAKISGYIKTPELERAPAKALVTGSKMPATAMVNLSINEIDELGITVSSKHLISKGTVLSLTGPFATEILGKAEHIMVTVVSNAVESEGVFKAYLEFDSAQETLSQQVRNWIATKN